MKFLIAILAALLCSPSLIAAPGGGHDKITAYDNKDIESKTFNRYELDIGYVFIWSFDRSIAGEVLRTEIKADGEGNVLRYSTSKFVPTPSSYNLVQTQRFDPPTTTTPPVLTDSTDYIRPVVILTNSMVPAIAWASAGKQISMSSGVSYFTDKKEVVGVENVHVTAGMFNKCLKIHSLRQYGSEFNSRMDWVCPEVGVVKRVHNGRILLDLTSVNYNE